MFTVRWENNALAAMAALWTMATDPAAVTAAADDIERRLAAAPLVHGMPVSEGLYAIEVPPLRALFEIDDIAMRVRVVSLNHLPEFPTP